MQNFIFKEAYSVKVNQVFPEVKNYHTTFVVLPAIGVPIRKYETLVAGLRAKGYAVIYADYPCCGENLPEMARGHDYNYADLINEFIPNLLKNAQSQNQVLLGHSLGGHLATLYTLEKNLPIVTVASGNIYYKNWDTLGRVKLLTAVGVFKSLSKIYGFFPGYKVGFGDKEAKSLMNDWCYTALTGKYTLRKPELKQEKGKGVFINIENDDFAPLKSMQHLAEMCGQYSLKQIKLAPDLKGNPHSVWLKNPQSIVDLIDREIEKYLI